MHCIYKFINISSKLTHATPQNWQTYYHYCTALFFYRDNVALVSPHKHTHTHTHTHTQKHTQTHTKKTHTHTRTHTHTCKHKHIHIYIHTCIHKHNKHTYKHTCTHTHTHTYIKTLPSYRAECGSSHSLSASSSVIWDVWTWPPPFLVLLPPSLGRWCDWKTCRSRGRVLISYKDKCYVLNHIKLSPMGKS